MKFLKWIINPKSLSSFENDDVSLSLINDPTMIVTFPLILNQSLLNVSCQDIVWDLVGFVSNSLVWNKIPAMVTLNIKKNRYNTNRSFPVARVSISVLKGFLKSFSIASKSEKT